MTSKLCPTCLGNLPPGVLREDDCTCQTLHHRIARALGWSLADAQSFSLPSLRELVRKGHPKLAHELTQVMRGPSYYVGEPISPNKPARGA
jgi:hypothetical protein